MKTDLVTVARFQSLSQGTVYDVKRRGATNLTSLNTFSPNPDQFCQIFLVYGDLESFLLCPL